MYQVTFSALRIARTIAFAGVLLLGGGALVRAAVPDQTGMAHGCYTSNGALRIVDPEIGQACKSNEKALDWNVRGSVAYQSFGAGHLDGATPIVVADVALPAGSYTMVATVEITNTGPAAVQIACTLAGSPLLAHQTVPPSNGTVSTFATMTMTGAAQLSNAATAAATCFDQSGSGSPTSLAGTITATSVSGVVVQVP
jgi:hypothetical protein